MSRYVSKCNLKASVHMLKELLTLLSCTCRVHSATCSAMVQLQHLAFFHFVLLTKNIVEALVLHSVPYVNHQFFVKLR